jgi:hypothetical protein
MEVQGEQREECHGGQMKRVFLKGINDLGMGS